MVIIAGLIGELVIACALCWLAAYRSEDWKVEYFYYLQPAWVAGSLMATLAPMILGFLATVLSVMAIATQVARRELYDWSLKRDVPAGMAIFNAVMLAIAMVMASVLAFWFTSGTSATLTPVFSVVVMGAVMLIGPLVLHMTRDDASV